MKTLLNRYYLENKKPHSIDSYKVSSVLVKCPRLDSNQHTLSSTTTSRWLVYQFQHLGKLQKRTNNFNDLLYHYFREAQLRVSSIIKLFITTLQMYDI